MASLSSHYPWALTPFLISAPMRLISLASLAASVTLAGGLGFIGAGNDASFDLDCELDEMSKLLESGGIGRRSFPFAGKGAGRDVDDAGGRFGGGDDGFEPKEKGGHEEEWYLPIGVGWILSTPTSDAEVGAQTLLSAHLHALLKHRPLALWLFAPPSLSTLTHWLTTLRSLSHTHNYTPDIYLQISSVSQALDFCSTPAGPPDMLVVQGNDAGGHGLTKGAGLTTLLPEVIDAVTAAHAAGNFAALPGEDRAKMPKFVAAGGIVDGRGVAAALALGAEGVVLGTRMLAAKEAVLSNGYRREVLRASDGGQTTVRSRVYDTLRGTSGWPAEYGGRGVINKSWEEYESGEVGEEEMKRRYAESVRMGDKGWGPRGRMTTYAGTGVGLVRKVQSAKEICDGVREECMVALGRANGRL